MSSPVDSLYKVFSNTPYTQTLSSSKSRKFIMDKETQLDRVFVISCYYRDTCHHEQRFVYGSNEFDAICDYLQTRPPGVSTLDQLVEYTFDQGLSICYLEV